MGPWESVPAAGRDGDRNARRKRGQEKNIWMSAG